MDGAPDALKLYAYVGVGDVYADAKRDGMDIPIGFGGCATWFKVADLERVEHPFHFLTGRVHHTSSKCHGARRCVNAQYVSGTGDKPLCRD